MTAPARYFNQMGLVEREPHIQALIERIVPMIRRFGPVNGLRLVPALEARLPGEPHSNIATAVGRLPLLFLDGGDVVLNEREIPRVLGKY